MTNLGLLLPSAVSQSPTILFPPSSHSPSTFAHNNHLCFTCSLRPPSRNSDTFTLQNKHTIKKNLHFSSNFSLFRLISSHILIGTHPFGAPSITFFHGESQTNISFPSSGKPIISVTLFPMTLQFILREVFCVYKQTLRQKMNRL